MSLAAREHPEPPRDLNRREPLGCTLPAGKAIYRIHKARQAALYFGRAATNRFDAPDRGYGVLYAGADAHVCFIEACGSEVAAPAVTGANLRLLKIATLTLRRGLRLIDIAASGGLARIGADNRLTTGPRSLAQRWSAAMRGMSCRPAGVCYRSRRDPARLAYAIFEADDPLFDVKDDEMLLARGNRRRLGELLSHYRVSLLEP